MRPSSADFVALGPNEYEHPKDAPRVRLMRHRTSGKYYVIIEGRNIDAVVRPGRPYAVRDDDCHPSLMRMHVILSPRTSDERGVVAVPDAKDGEKLCRPSILFHERCPCPSCRTHQREWANAQASMAKED